MYSAGSQGDHIKVQVHVARVTVSKRLLLQVSLLVVSCPGWSLSSVHEFVRPRAQVGVRTSCQAVATIKLCIPFGDWSRQVAIAATDIVNHLLIDHLVHVHNSCLAWPVI